MRHIRMKWYGPVAVLALILAGTVSARAQMDIPKPVHVEILPTVDAYPVGGSYSILIHVTVDDPWHINSDEPLEDFLVPSTVSLELPEGMSAGKLNFPEGHLRDFDFSETELSVFEQEFSILGTITVSNAVEPRMYTLKGYLEYQACNDVLCLPPQPGEFELEMKVVSAGQDYDTLNEDLLAEVSAALETAGGDGNGDGPLGKGFDSRGLFVMFLLIFVGGLALNLTPCVYPLIPITIGYFGGQAEGRKGRLLVHAILYVLGMSVTYSALGVFASLTGSLLGTALQNPFVLIFIALVMVVLALGMFGLYEITVPQFIAGKAGQAKQGYFGTAFMGLTVGIIAAPCIGPFVLGLMTYVGERGDPVMGFLMFFVLAIGLGTPFLFLALFSGGINRLPSSGDWMVWVKKVFGVVLLGMALYFLDPLITESVMSVLVILLAVVAGIYLGFVEGSGRGRPEFLWIKRIVGVVIILVGIWFVVPSDEHVAEPEWIPYSSEVLEEAEQGGMPVVIDFSADWCIPCKELDRFTFSDPRVLELSKHVMPVKADLTSYDSEASVEVRERFEIKGVPTVVFLDEHGSEREDMRFVGFIEADAFVEKLQALVGEKEAGDS